MAVTTTGRVEGTAANGVLSFSGLPYGQAERFRKAVPPPAWTGTRSAAGPGPRAVQAVQSLDNLSPAVAAMTRYFFGGDPVALGRDLGVQSEDCLVLNVLTPATDGSRRPVLVYLHGGGFDSGSGVASTWATTWAREQDLVVVGVNHRLNVFGFLHLSELDDSFPDSGNAGMLDLVLALTWVRDNIAAFGGDPDNVTVFGESGGGMKVGTLLAMPEASGLLHQAIIQSGSRLDALDSHAATAGAERLLEVLGTTPTGLLDVPAKALHAAAVQARLPIAPVVDGRSLPRAAFTPDATPLSANIPLLVGHTLDEMSMFVAGAEEQQLVRTLGLPDEDLRRLRQAYAAAYPTLPSREVVQRVLSDHLFGRPAHVQADRKSEQTAPVFRYDFTYVPPVLDGALGAFHTAELPLVLRVVAYPETEELSRALAAAWAAFARTGDPSTADLAWPAYDTTTRRAMRFDSECSVTADAFGPLRAAWADLPHGNIQRLLTLGAEAVAP